MLKTVLIEDDFFQMEVLCDLLDTSFPSIKVVSKAINAFEGIRELLLHKPDLVFLDIDLPDKSGFDLLKALPDQRFEIIFVTAHEKFALEAFNYDAISFLLKPLTMESIQIALDKLKRKRKNENSVLQVQDIIANLKNSYDNQHKIAIPSLKKIEYIRITDIIRLEADGNYTAIFLNTGKKVITSRQIGDYEKQLSGNKFFRIHEKHLINLRFVKSFIKGSGGMVEMEDGCQLSVSRRRKDELIQALGGA